MFKRGFTARDDRGDRIEAGVDVAVKEDIVVTRTDLQDLARSVFTSTNKFSDLVTYSVVDWPNVVDVLSPIKNQGQCGFCSVPFLN